MRPLPRALLALATAAVGVATTAATPAAAVVAPEQSVWVDRPAAPSTTALAPASGHGSADVAASSARVVLTGLNNPRQLSFSRDWTLHVAEAGRGGRPCTDAALVLYCPGATGSVSAVRQPAITNGAAPRRTVGGLLSVAVPDGGYATGSTGVAVRGRSTYVAVGATPLDPVRSTPAGRQAGTLLRVRDGRVRVLADLAAAERRLNPDRGEIASDPAQVLALPGRQLVADRAADTVWEVRQGVVRPFAVLADHDDGSAQPVALAAGPDGSIYVGELNSDLDRATSRIYRFAPDGRRLGYRGGFRSVRGLAVDAHNNLYLTDNRRTAEGRLTGQVSKVTPAGRRTSVPVPYPGGVAVSWSGNVYVAAWAIADRNGTSIEGGEPSRTPPGQLWRLRF